MKNITWEQFIKSILDEKQIEILKHSLKINARVHFYGYGLGKSTMARVLRDFGFNVSEAGDLEERGSFGSLSVPNDIAVTCFCVNKHTPKELIADLYEQLRDSEESFMNWVIS